MESVLYHKPNNRREVINELRLCVCKKCGTKALETNGRKCYVCEKGTFIEVREYCLCCGENITTSREVHMHNCKKWIKGSGTGNMFGFA